MLTRDVLLKQLDFNSPYWVLLESWLKQERDNKVGLLIGAQSEKDADKVRGAIQYIDSLLGLKRAAILAANESR